MKVGYNGFFNRISVDLLERLHGVAYPERELDGAKAEESLRSAARSVALAINAADMSRFVQRIFDAMYKFVAEGGSTEYFMTDGDIDGSSKIAPA